MRQDDPAKGRPRGGPARQHGVMLSRSERFRAAAIAALGTPVVEALGGTYTWHEHGAGVLDVLAQEGRPPILAFWHGRILSTTLYLRDRGIVAMTSQSFDGEWISRLIQRFGFDVARGSTSQGGAKALVQLRREMRRGRPVIFTVDGPRGPARIAQPGAVWLASASGSPVVPFHIEAVSSWSARSWDRQQIPKPGSEVVVVFGTPMDVRPRVGADAIEAARQELEHDLGRLEVRATELAALLRR